MEFAIDFKQSVGEDTAKLQGIYEDMRRFIDTKLPNQIDTPEIRDVKGFIRKTEAISGARFAGLPDSNIHFQALPFYETGKIKKNSVGEEDVQLTMALLQQIKPHQVFAAGDFADPNGTHIVCFNIIVAALTRLRETEAWVNDCWVWLYRGAWQEFPTHEIEMAVPLSPAEVLRKRNAIFKHQSQKDRPVFPGDDAREFWVRAEDRNRETAQNYDKLGMAEYAAMEAFVRYHF